MGLFSRKAKSPAGDGREVVVQTVGTMGVDADYETDVVGEKRYRDALVAILARHAKSPEYAARRVPVKARLVPLGVQGHGAVAVLIDGERVGQVEDDWVRRYGRVYETLADVTTADLRIECGAVIIWRSGDPMRDPAVPLSVRLDLHDDGAAQEWMAQRG